MCCGKIVKVAIKDKRLSASHMSLILAILILKNETRTKGPIRVSRKQIMERSHIGSIVTYHKCLKELIKFRYIEYIPSYHPKLGSTIRFLD